MKMPLRHRIFHHWQAQVRLAGALCASIFLLSGMSQPSRAQETPTPELPCGRATLYMPREACPRAFPTPLSGVKRLPLSASAITLQYAQVLPDTPTYGSAENGYHDLNVKRLLGNEHGRGLVYVTTEDYAEVKGTGWYKINGGEWLSAERITFIKPPLFRGVTFNGTSEFPTAWVVSATRPSAAPGEAPDPRAPWLPRYQLVQVLETQLVDYWEWYRIGPDLWVEQRKLAVAWRENKPAKDIADKWISVDEYEQVLTAYQGERMVFATLISSGLSQWATQPGLYRIYAPVKFDNMSGAYSATKSDYYYLEDVPWTMYFDGDRALHGAYWHDGFGFRKSHGCVNLSPIDAEWLFGWAEKGTWVWVHNPFPETN